MNAMKYRRAIALLPNCRQTVVAADALTCIAELLDVASLQKYAVESVVVEIQCQELVVGIVQASYESLVLFFHRVFPVFGLAENGEVMLDLERLDQAIDSLLRLARVFDVLHDERADWHQFVSLECLEQGLPEAHRVALRFSEIVCKRLAAAFAQGFGQVPGYRVNNR